MSLFQDILTFVKNNVTLNQDGLSLYEVRVRHEPEESRIVLSQTSEIGIDFKVDAVEFGIGVLAKQMGVDNPSKKK